MQFTSEQKRIFSFVQHESGHGIIDAVAGSGKTTTIMECADYVSNKSDILFCAFNNSIANEIRRKFQKRGINEVTVKTIHSLGLQILKDNNSTGLDITLNDHKYQQILKNEEILESMEPNFIRILEINGLNLNALDNRTQFAAKNLIEKVKGRLLEIIQKFRATLTKDDLSEFKSMVEHFGIFNQIEIAKESFIDELKEYFECHRFLLKTGNDLSRKSMIIDFTDMLYLPFEWHQQPARKYGFLFVDECQDLSKSQFAVVAKYGKKDGRILAVGDPQQSIYGFTGADINSFQRVKDYTKAVELPLTTCFRCPGKVIELARTIRTDMTGNKEEEGIVHYISFDEVVKMARGGDLIISRLRAPILLLVFEFIDQDIKVHIHEDEVNDIIYDIKRLFKQEELNALIDVSIPKGFDGLKAIVINRWKWLIEKDASRIIDSNERNLFIEEEMKLLSRKLEFLHRKFIQWRPACPTIIDILKRIKEYISSTDNPIKLSTIHRAKGLENERVFILNYDKLPFIRLHQKDWEMIQEVNLKYVAITRTLHELVLIEEIKEVKADDSGNLFDTMPF